MKRLVRKADDYGMHILFNGITDKIDNKDEITDITYGPSISREWLFERPIDNPEWALRNSMGKRDKDK